MVLYSYSRIKSYHGPILFIFLTLPLVFPATAVYGQQAKSDVLQIGNSGSLAGSVGMGKEKVGMMILQAYIKEETGLNNDIQRLKSWQELADKMQQGQVDIGVFQGYEFAWAQAEYPGLKPLALAVNVYLYPVAYVMARRDDSAADFAGLEGQSLSVPDIGLGFLRLFVDRQCEARGKKADAFFTKITAPDNAEDALDDVVDGKIKATVVDHAILTAYKQRKPGRFKRLKEVAQSEPFPPVTVAYAGSTLDEKTLRRFADGLMNASKNEKGETLLTLLHVTGFSSVPHKFEQVLVQTRKAYAAPTVTTSTSK